MSDLSKPAEAADWVAATVSHYAHNPRKVIEELGRAHAEQSANYGAAARAQAGRKVAGPIDLAEYARSVAILERALFDVSAEVARCSERLRARFGDATKVEKLAHTRRKVAKPVSRCADCGEAGAKRGHWGCPYQAQP